MSLCIILGTDIILQRLLTCDRNRTSLFKPLSSTATIHYINTCDDITTDCLFKEATGVFLLSPSTQIAQSSRETYHAIKEDRCLIYNKTTDSDISENPTYCTRNNFHAPTDFQKNSVEEMCANSLNMTAAKRGKKNVCLFH